MLSFHSRCLSSGIAHVGVILVDVAVDVIVLLLLPVVVVVVVGFGFVVVRKRFKKLCFF